jgi:hypothetical protein
VILLRCAMFKGPGATRAAPDMQVAVL